MGAHRHATFVSFIAGILASLGLQFISSPPKKIGNATLICELTENKVAPSVGAISGPNKGGVLSSGGKLVQTNSCKLKPTTPHQKSPLERAAGFSVLISALMVFLLSARLEEIKQDVFSYASLKKSERVAGERRAYSESMAVLLSLTLAAVITAFLGIWGAT